MEQNNAALGTVAYMTVGFVVLGVLACAGFFIGLVVPCGKQVAGGAAGKSTKSISKAEQITCVSLGAARCLRSLLLPPRARILQMLCSTAPRPHLLTPPRRAPVRFPTYLSIAQRYVRAGVDWNFHDVDAVADGVVAPVASADGPAERVRQLSFSLGPLSGTSLYIAAPQSH